MAQAAAGFRDLSLAATSRSEGYGDSVPTATALSPPEPSAVWLDLTERQKAIWLRVSWKEQFSQDPEAKGAEDLPDLTPERVRLVMDAVSEGRPLKGFEARHVGLVIQKAALYGVELRPRSTLRTVRAYASRTGRPLTRQERLQLWAVAAACVIAAVLVVGAAFFLLPASHAGVSPYIVAAVYALIAVVVGELVALAVGETWRRLA